VAVDVASLEVRLFGSRISPFVEKVVRALLLKDVPFELVPVRGPADFRRWNPQTRKMPVLEAAGRRTYDSTFILRRLEELVPDPPLFSADPDRAARQRFVEDWSDESLYWSVMALRWNEANAAATTDQVASSLPLPAVVRGLVKPVLRRQIGAQATAQGIGRLPLAMVLDELDRRFGELETLLGSTPYFFAERPGAADVAIFGQIETLCSGPTPEGAELLERHRALCDHRRRVGEATLATSARRERASAPGSDVAA
jgi:glutathione S-transferase